jgi:hypothetical protein
MPTATFELPYSRLKTQDFSIQPSLLLHRLGQLICELIKAAAKRQARHVGLFYGCSQLQNADLELLGKPAREVDAEVPFPTVDA